MKKVAVAGCTIDVPDAKTGIDIIGVTVVSLGDNNASIDGNNVHKDKIDLLVTSASSTSMPGFSMVPSPPGYPYSISGSSQYCEENGGKLVLEGDGVDISIPMVNSSTGATSTLSSKLEVKSAGQDKVESD